MVKNNCVGQSDAFEQDTALPKADADLPVKRIVVIPAYEPDEKLVMLVKRLSQEFEGDIIVVNDGSGEDKSDVFISASEYATVLVHEKNMGKGEAMKTAFKYVLDGYGAQCVVITADADGQHTVEDISAVAQAACQSPASLVLGSRRFTGKVPFKSRAGNAITRFVFRLSSGAKVYDTQTGLRAFSGGQLEYMLQITGSRYEYEMNVLMNWAKARKPFVEVPIDTVYLDGNASSHFHPVRDSFKVYKEILKFGASSIISFVADYLLFTIFSLITKSFLRLSVSAIVSNVTARTCSATLNYTLNRKFVFKSNGSVVKSALQYALLAVFILALNTALLTLLVNTILPNRYVAKIIVETVLFIFSCIIQKLVIFRKKTD